MTETTLFEPCANSDGGINILRDGVPIYSTHSLYDEPEDCPDGKYVNNKKWHDAELLCQALALIERSKNA